MHQGNRYPIRKMIGTIDKMLLLFGVDPRHASAIWRGCRPILFRRLHILESLTVNLNIEFVPVASRARARINVLSLGSLWQSWQKQTIHPASSPACLLRGHLKWCMVLTCYVTFALKIPHILHFDWYSFSLFFFPHHRSSPQSVWIVLSWPFQR